MRQQNKGLTFRYYVDNEEVSKKEYFRAYVQSKMSPSHAAKCVQLIYFQIWFVYYGFDDTEKSIIIHCDQESKRTYIHITEYALKVFVSFKDDICSLYEAVPA